MEFGRRYGSRPAGYYSRADESGQEGSTTAGEGGLEGVERLDGTLFIRVTGLCGERLGWAYEGGELESWDRDGFF